MSVSNLFVPNNFSIFAKDVSFQNSGGSVTPLNYYEEAVHTSIFTGGGLITGVLTVKFIRIGKQVTLFFPTIQGLATAAITNNDAIPTRFRPTAQQTFIVQGITNGTVGPNQVTISTGGILSFSTSAGAAFSAGTNGPAVGCITYTLN